MASSFSANSLNAAQKEAVYSINGPVLILAGAGTGKTRTVTCRIAHMLEQGIASKNILAVTFTNKAANEMKDRIAEMVGRQASRQMIVSTFHSLCARILREDIDKIGYKNNFSIYTGSDQSGLISRLIIRHGGKNEKIRPNDVLAVLGRVKNTGADIDSIEDNFISRVARSYQNELIGQNAVDFDDLLILAERVLREFPDVREAWRKRFRYITVDEFQDTNSLQMSLLKQLVGPDHNICVVGDDDQSIYGWRGAQISNILDFESFFPDPKVIKLEENYRCTASILNVANALIKHNFGRREKTLRAHKQGGDSVSLIAMPGDAEEAEYIVTDIESIRRTSKKSWEDFAILFRANTQGRILEQTMREHKIPYRVIGAQSFFDRREVKDLIAYLNLMDNPQADLHLLRVLNTPPRGISHDTTASFAIDWSREHKQSVWEALNDDGFRQAISSRARNSVIDFCELVERYAAMFKESRRDFSEIFEELIKEIEYEQFITRSCKTESEEHKRLITVGDVVAGLRNYWEPGKSLRDYLSQVSLDQNDQEEDDLERKSGVCLITMHASKGLEFPVVYLVGLEEGILPHKRSLEEGTCDEERRLLYVGITRAQENLTMTYCATRLRYGDRVSCECSSFIKEIPEDMIFSQTWEGIMESSTSEEEESDFFASLRDLLSEDD